MISVIPVNYKSLIFDPQGQEGDKITINGLAAGYLSPNFPHVLGDDGKPPMIDIAKIVKHFHAVEGELFCVYTGAPAEGVNVLDGDTQNFLISNLEPVCKSWIDSQPYLAKASITKTFSGVDADFDIEIYGAPLFKAEEILSNLQIPEVPGELGLAHSEAELLWVWNHLTKVTLLKGLTSITRRNKQTGISVSLTNKDVFEFTFKLLHQDFDTQEN